MRVHPGRRTGRCGRRLAAAIAIGLALASSGFPATTARAVDPGRGFTAHAWAQGSRVTYAMPGYLIVDTLADAGAPVADGVLTSGGDGLSFASVPYPGETATSAPGLAGASDAPQPYFVTAQSPETPEARSEPPGGGFRLLARAGAAFAEGDAQSRRDGGDAYTSEMTSNAKVEQLPDGSVVASAIAVARGLSFGGGVLQIATVTATSRTVRTPTGKPTTTTSLQFNGAEVLGQPVTIDRDGLTVASVPITVPDAVAAPVRGALQAAGISVRTADGTKTAEGGSADALIVEVKRPLPLPDEPRGEAVYRIGGASTSIFSGGAAPPLADEPAAALHAPVSEPQDAPVAEAAAPGNEPVAPATTSFDPPALSAAAPATPERVLLARSFQAGITLFYSMLAVAGLLAVVSAALWRRGEVNRWTL